MKKLFLLCAVLSVVFAKIETVNVTPENIKNYEQIIDIRTPMEWYQTGTIKGAKLITFDPYDKEKFLKELGENFDLKKPIALICRSGNRSFNAARMIDSDNLNIINLNGGMGSLIRQGYEPTPYTK
ncbi:rhodanese-like domain-containing protein [Campylobacter sp.]|uniref:rhodanese-like domain-containing protein n=1 Tax=Campylobacter sp. TaxID=205 RepID=UPI0027113358|nr:rhodanese-like domain-containing protein [Campylobacter sp.]